MRATSWYIAGVSAAAVAMFVAWLHLLGAGFGWSAFWAGLVLAGVCAASRRLPISLGLGRASFEVVDATLLVALVLGGPLTALLAAVPSMLYRERLRTLFQGSAHVVQVLGAALVFESISSPLLLGQQFDSSFVYGVAAAGLVLFLSDILIGSLLLRIKYGASLAELLKEFVLPPLPSNALAIATTLGVSYVVVAFGPIAALVLFCGVVLSFICMNFVRNRLQKTKDLEQEVAGLRQSNESLREELLSSHLAFAGRVVQSLGRKDGHAAAHAAASAVYAGDVCEELGLDPRRVRTVRTVALLQNVGLVALPDEVLLTPPGRLNSVGRMHLEEHPSHSERMLAAIPGFQEASRWARWHHEKVDGTGYPDRIRGEWLPLEAKILSVTAAYADLVLDNPHGPGLVPAEARLRITEGAGTAFDRQVTRVLLMVLDSRDESYASASDERFAFPAHGSVTPAPVSDGSAGRTGTA
jgi:hypothetical protein